MTSPETSLQVYLFTDLVGSTALKRRLGDMEGARAIGKHDWLFRECMKRHGGTEQANPGDGFFATFPLPSAALLCAIEFQQGLGRLDTPEPLRTRVGIHMGESVEIDADEDTGELLGLAVDTAGRVMGLAVGEQILLTRHAFDSVRQQVREAPDGSAVEYLAHGPYLFKGVDDPIEVYEAGIEGLSPLRPPEDSEKARRAVTPGDEETLGWRPAIGQEVHGRDGWVLEQKLGEGGFGEVWLARVDVLKGGRKPPVDLARVGPKTPQRLGFSGAHEFLDPTGSGLTPTQGGERIPTACVPDSA